ncbi:uncharacterized protein LOC107265573 [Cephus cinctus]|uniref:Uncharacterized protein LOC107265573 n=1 Tax=Cephus cinctus TaxID=211228 RepID=A0AAJ7FGG7_CEPCN|nr:uncharacterized protein LOC107265573 [Cephus cinctus]XP_015590651.1 uncharacterized protein LOC107265573 [Cephus cinctus]XP_015590653.1 uncharacterized protein LOC107265573 [Cephus cinctus]XP_024938676.1 uncharacterized protein LOC107265573 [Cephus cinctus]
MMKNSLKLNTSKYQCIVCRLDTLSVGELHYHQTYKHTPEELSLSAISLQGLINIRDPAFDIATSTESFSSDLTKQPKFYMLSANLLSDTNNNSNNNNCALNFVNTVHAGKEYGFDVTNMKNNSQHSFKIPKVEGFSSGVKRESLQYISAEVKKDIPFTELEIELMKTVDISNETFLEGVHGLCEDLNEIKNKILLGKWPLKKNSTHTRLARGKQNRKIWSKSKARKMTKKPITESLSLECNIKLETPTIDNEPEKQDVILKPDCSIEIENVDPEIMIIDKTQDSMDDKCSWNSMIVVESQLEDLLTGKYIKLEDCEMTVLNPIIHEMSMDLKTTNEQSILMSYTPDNVGQISVNTFPNETCQLRLEDMPSTSFAFVDTSMNDTSHIITHHSTI